MTPPLPDLILYGRADCALCAEARELVIAMLADRAARGLPAPALIERDIDSDPAWHRAFFASIPVVELGDRRLESATSAARLRRLLADQLDGVPT
ncbi:MAG: glutaredoxin family protein [Chloroflexota bacterium]